MRATNVPMIATTATLFVLASAAGLAYDPTAPRPSPGLERTVSFAELCADSACSIAYKSGAAGQPSHVVPVH